MANSMAAQGVVQLIEQRLTQLQAGVFILPALYWILAIICNKNTASVTILLCSIKGAQNECFLCYIFFLVQEGNYRNRHKQYS